MPKPIFEIRRTSNLDEWQLPVTRRMCVGTDEYPFMFGGIALAAVLRTLERISARPVTSAAAQFFAHAGPGEILDLRTQMRVDGKSNSQVRIGAYRDEDDILCVAAALGARDHPVTEQWVKAPSVPAPDALADSFAWPSTATELRNSLEIRDAPSPDDDDQHSSGRRAFWIRSRDGLPLDVGLLAIYADFVTIGVDTVLGPPWKASSLDNTLRVRRLVPADWVLCEIAMHGVNDGIAHGDMRMFAPDGELIAIASQSMILRRYDD